MKCVSPPAGVEEIRAAGIFGGGHADGVYVDAESAGGRDDELSRKVSAWSLQGSIDSSASGVTQYVCLNGRIPHPYTGLKILFCMWL